MAYGKLAKVDREFTVTICDNGFMLAVSGRTENDDWANVKVICKDISALVEEIVSVHKTPIND